MTGGRGLERSVAVRRLVAAGLVLWLAGLGSCGLGSSIYRAEPQTPGGEQGVPVEVEFHGAVGLEGFRLRRAVEDRLYDLSRRPDQTVVLQDATFDLEDLYRSKGFPDVSVDYSVSRPDTPSEAHPMLVTFDVHEGPRVTVRNMELTGNNAFDDGQLLAFWLRENSGTLGLGAPYFVADDVRGFATSIRLFYRGRGYLEAHVMEPDVTRLPDGTEVDVRIEIDEGRLFHIEDATIDDALKQALGDHTPELPTGKAATANTVSQFRDDVLSRLRSSGYPDPHLFVDIRQEPTDPLIHLHLKGQPGRRGRIVSIDVTGNAATEKGVILNRLDLEPGDLYDGTKIDDALRNLYLSGLFRTVRIQKSWKDGKPDAKSEGDLDLTIQVDEAETKKLELLAGYGSYERLRGMVRFEENNLFGTGRAFSAEARVSTKGERGVLSIVDPRLFGSANVLSLSGDAYRREEPSFTDQAFGGTVALQREWIKNWSTRVGYSYRKHNGSDIDIDPAEVAVTSYFEGDVFAETRLDRRDSPIYPRHGYQVSLQFDANNPAFGANIEFQRFRFGASAYLPLSDDLTLALRSQQGLLWPGQGPANVPLQERFFNGGQNTVRSFHESDLGPKDSMGRPLGGEYPERLQRRDAPPPDRHPRGGGVRRCRQPRIGRHGLRPPRHALRYRARSAARLADRPGPLRRGLESRPPARRGPLGLPPERRLSVLSRDGRARLSRSGTDRTPFLPASRWPPPATPIPVDSCRRRRPRSVHAAGMRSTSCSSPATPTSTTRRSRWRCSAGCSRPRASASRSFRSRTGVRRTRSRSSGGRGSSSRSARGTWTR